ncbi:MAG: phosphatidylserine/phosphatidylglycerophosphate/cardiolipin synthase family protein [Actinomycetota bacterium]
MSDTFTLLSTEAFAVDLLRRINEARHRVSIQLMTFDGDEAGLPVADALLAAAARGVDVRLAVDCFALRYVSDERTNRSAVRAEFATTTAMYRRLADGGVDLRFTSPNGPFALYALARNHKKLFVIDNRAYLGGINVSDHNYAWHDFMVAITDQALVDAVVEDFEHTMAGERVRVDKPILTNEAIEETFDEMVSSARDRLVVGSPYAIDRQLAKLIERSPARSKTAIVAAENNFLFLDLITPYLLHRLASSGVELSTYANFSHAKFVLADDRLLIGSSNYGRHSFWCNQEIGLVIDDTDFIERFTAEMLSALSPLEHDASLRRRALGRVASVAMDTYLRAYARLIVPRVPTLARDVP